MKIDFIRFKWVAMVLLGIAMNGCVGTTPPVQFYMLEPVPLTASSPTRMTEKQGIRIGLDPVEVPEYIDRPQIVTHLDRAEYQLDEFNRWLEPLRDNLTRVIAENLSEMLKSEDIDILHMSRPVQTGFNLFVQILRMDAKLGQEMVLITRWSLFEQNDNAPIRTTRLVFREAVDNDTYQGLVEVYNRMIESLSRAIADGITPIVTSKAGL